MTYANLLNESSAAVSEAELTSEVMTFTALQYLAGDIGTIHATLLPPPRRKRPAGETPIIGEGATARWIALYDRATQLRNALPPGNSVATRQVQRAVRSLFLYEHQLTATARRRAHTKLWQRDQQRALPPFVDRVRWAKCRCEECQPAIWEATAIAMRTLALKKSA